MSVDGDRARAEVTDDGPGFRIDSPPRPRGHAGWGLLLVDTLSDRWGVKTNSSTTVWFELRLRPPDGRDRGDDGLSAPAATV